MRQHFSENILSSKQLNFIIILAIVYKKWDSSLYADMEQFARKLLK